MSDFPALGTNSLRDGNGPGLLSFSSIASGSQPLREPRKEADFTIDDFPALTASNHNGPMSRSAAMITPSARDDMTIANMLAKEQAAAAANGMGGPTNGSGPMAPVTTFGGPSVIGMPGPRPMLPQNGPNVTKRPVGSTAVGGNYASKAQQSQSQEAGTNASQAPMVTQPPTGTSTTGPVGAGASPTPPSQGDRFGLLGLIDVIRMTDPDMNMLALGVDLTGLGLNLNSSDSLYSTFMSPFADNPTLGAEPQFTLPPCYNLPQPPPPAISKIGSFSDETLFYIFYAMPREAVQEAAAQELYNRAWRFHKELKLWVCKEPGSEPAIKGAGFERGVYIFFDPTTWSKVKKEWVLYYEQLEERGPLGGGAAGTTGRPGTPGVIGSSVVSPANATMPAGGPGVGALGLGLGIPERGVLGGLGDGTSMAGGAGSSLGLSGAGPAGLFQQQFGLGGATTGGGGLGQGGMWGGPSPALPQQPSFFGSLSMQQLGSIPASTAAGGVGGPTSPANGQAQPLSTGVAVAAGR